MCGIFGHTETPKKNMHKSRDALHTLTHRGPDQWGEWSNDRVYLGHRRLSILDLSENGRQPMTDRKQEVIITVNGEIYNYLQLKKELQKTYEFKSTTDSEVILYGYKKWGIQVLLEKIDGMYAFCIYDVKKQKIFLARDRAGIKPLYYSNIGNNFAWASELKALENFYHSKVLTIDHTALFDYLTYIYIPTPKTLYKNIYKLQPAHYLEIDLNPNHFVIKKYWELDTSAQDISLPQAKFELKQLTKQSVEEQLMSDVPVGFFLSGGMDSSTVVSLATKFSDKINTYSIGFDDKAHDETEYAKIVADYFRTNHKTQIVSSKDVLDLFSNLRDWYDEPFADTSAFPTYLVSKFAKKDSTVVLTGDGGDELFGGYKWYQNIKTRKDILKKQIGLKKLRKTMVRTLQKKITPLKLELQDSTFIIEQFLSQSSGGLREHQKEHYAELLNIEKDYDSYWHIRKYYKKELPLRTRIQYIDFHTYLPDDILTKVDRTSMAVSLEARVPFLSKKLIEFSFSLPEAIRYKDNELKGLMKETFKDLLPESIITRDKKGFSIPLRNWANSLVKTRKTIQEEILFSLFKEIIPE
ncbi:MAG: asparagine synthase (glutamine-hydrolyzing) [Desulfobacteraceae bacterium]|nr:MAG: asparagine synthase (glutamine-hydrolyzing) [Desulfobacteraceae bacterium]